MRRRRALGIVAVALLLGWPRGASRSEASAVCSEGWYRMVEASVPTGDGQGHGPDLGSEEWKSVVEFKLGIRGEPGVPERDSEDWCRHIDQLVESRNRGRAKSAKGPSFPCSEVEAGSTEAMICSDEELAELDRKLSEVYAAAYRKASNEHPPVLEAEQRGWIKGRDECWKSEDERGCVREEYARRIAELQARYRLVPFSGPVRFACDGEPANEVVATYFQTDPPTLIAERGDSVSLMYLQPSASGSRYQGPNESLWEHQGRAAITWGYGSREMECEKAP